MIKIKTYLANFVSSFISIKMYYILSYLHNRKKIINLKQPSNLSEFIISNIVFGRVNSLANYTDKYLVRDYVKQKGLNNILPLLYGVWEDVESIDFKSFPEKFALKLNFGCGFNIICFDKSIFNVENAKLQLSTWMKIKIFWKAEPHYDFVKRRIILEELIQDKKGKLPVDYKFMCINGIPDHILVIIDRDSDYKLLTYDLDWNKINLLENKYKIEMNIEKPLNLSKMIECARILSNDFDFVRVDLYDSGERVIFGELTFTPQGGLLRYYTIDALKKMFIKNR